MKKILVFFSIVLFFGCDLIESYFNEDEDTERRFPDIEVSIDGAILQNNDTFYIQNASTNQASILNVKIENKGNDQLVLSNNPQISSRSLLSSRAATSFSESELSLCFTEYQSAIASCTIDNGSDLTGNPTVAKYKNSNSTVFYEYSYLFNSDKTVPISGDGKYNFNNYISSSGVTINGSLNFSIQFNGSTTNSTFTYTGTLVFSYNNKSSNIIYNYTIVTTNGSYVYSGYQEIDGKRHEYNSDGTITYDLGSGTGTGTEIFKISETLTTVVSPGLYTTFQITFTPKTAGVYNSAVVISSNDVDTPLYTIYITGEIIADTSSGNEAVNTGKWLQLGDAFPNVNSSSVGLVINPLTDQPYTYVKDDTAGNKIHVKKWDGANWISLGYPSTGSGDLATMDIGNDGIPVICFKDSANNNDFSIKRYDGNTWSTIGSFPANSAYFNNSIPIAIGADKKPVIVVTKTAPGMGGEVYRWSSGTTWTPLGFITHIQTNNISPVLSIGSDNKPVVAYKTQENLVYVVKWEDEGSGQIWANKMGNLGKSVINYPIALSITSNNIPIIVFSDNEYSNKPKVMKYNVYTGWENLGFANDSAANGSLGIAIHPTGQYPIVADGGGVPGLTKYNGSTWEKYDFVPDNYCYDQSNWIDVDSKGNIYIATIIQPDGYYHPSIYKYTEQ